MTEQIQTHPKSFEVAKWFGPQTAQVVLPDDALDALIKMSDKLIEDKKTLSHGNSLAGVIDSELRIYKSDMEEAGVDQLLESCVKSYVVHCTKAHGFFSETQVFDTFINSAWIVSQYANEYNPLHNHTGCEMSGVIYLKTPNVKGRRNIESKKGKQEGDGDINFVYNAASQRNEDVFEKGLVQITPKPGLMLMFPSYLLHTVYPFIGEGERRSIAFNATYRIVEPTGGKQKEGEPLTGNIVAGNMQGVQNSYFYMKEKPSE
tara:strand:+ start:25 stop:807 length:783 start_codon:yes stop_codon:yes gene_type:complete